ncbi:SagB/ThcOx family dehydrogenase [Oceanobacillus indicireducens]|uniref:Nitroreductase domain-containing protein n=1 Tax=Oceanobacillus indicireducens TaxID=1004261 RepID=A0A918D0W7_9BACI|nr:SagB/ThcOx family dehydrogenase [Oceanobacillus indicireducens]GGN55421.1 hypothetical protein GCM10007971_14180 [Oceanobacillus indicireducens]
MKTPKLKTSKNVVFYIEKCNLICDLFLDHKQISLSPDLMPFLTWLGEWRSYKEILQYIKNQESISDDELISLIQTLLSMNVLVEKDSKRNKLENELMIWDEWGMAPKYYHFSSKGLEKDNFISVEKDAVRLTEKYKKEKMPSIYKEENEFIERFTLPTPVMKYNKSFFTALTERQTIRTFCQEDSLNLQQLSDLLFAVWGAQSCWLSKGFGEALLKTSPSGGSRHSIEVYLAIMNVDNLPQGYYHYSVLNHELVLLEESKGIRDEMIEMCADQPHVGLPSVVFIYTSQIKRVIWKYSVSKSYKIIFMDLGHLSQTLYLTSSAMDLGCFFTAATREDMLENKLNLNMADEIILGVSGVGVKTEKVDKNKQSGRFIRDDLLFNN